jgi:SPP1 gp7 family putative phage head morphogenesis protein
MAITRQATTLYVADLAKSEVVVRTALRRIGLNIRTSALDAFNLWVTPADGTLSYELPGSQLTLELSSALVYAYLLGSERVHKHLASESVSLAIKHSRERGTYGDVSQATVQYLKRIFNSKAVEIVQGLNEKASNAIRKIIATAVKQGAGRKYIARRIELAFNRLGITGQTKYTIATIARTQAQIAFNAGKWNAEQSPEVKESLWGYTYQTVGDDKVRPDHELIDGVTLPKGSAFWSVNYPPNGYNCRCQAIALFQPEKLVRPPSDYGGPDEDFNFNPGKVFSGIV